MIGRLNHVALAVADLEQAVNTYRLILGAQVDPPQHLPEFAVTVVFVRLPNTNVELLSPLGDNSPISKFLARNPAGGMHHICYEVQDITSAVQRLQEQGMQVLDPSPKRGAHGKPVVFLHPKSMGGVLVELEEA
ncbi:methylmalonyl-CoA epimerase [Candidatus Magnetaquicoccus inordinatus]|uniref:methylmalonyl-CoA epimerase n=1 Tax=Candidatus Magnetaquicoccus inordinatus TaxID=2496818 RepID=UPI00102B648C|nr:methylmalonyl-CoA epimerase [Candidatus Magnetaquicoccus inordinatus]